MTLRQGAYADHTSTSAAAEDTWEFTRPASRIRVHNRGTTDPIYFRVGRALADIAVVSSAGADDTYVCVAGAVREIDWPGTVFAVRSFAASAVACSVEGIDFVRPG